MSVGIYKIQNLINGKVYIGQSINIEKRWSNEKASAFDINDKAYEYPLSRAFRKYGLENFVFSIVEETSIENLDDKERYWINYYNSFFNGYNQTLGGSAGHLHNLKAKENIIGIINDLENTNLYHKEIAQKWNVSQETVQGINTGRYWYQENKDYPLQKQHKKHSNHYTKDKIIVEQHLCKDCGVVISSGAMRCKDCAARASRKVERPTAEELYNYLTSIKGNFLEASRHYGVSDNAIRKWCKKYNIPSSSKNYKT